MTSAHKRDITNLRERAISTDRNRAQSFAAADRAEVLRYLFDLVHSSTATRTFEYGGPLLAEDFPPDTDPGAIDTPLRADVIDGLVVTPIVGTTSLHVSPGIVGLHDPDGQTGSSQADPPNADDSSYKLVIDDGIDTNGVLTIASNPGPGARLDVIECRRSEVVIETAVRDVFDPSTGTASPQTVDKVGKGSLEFRVRQGTAGNGYPGNAQGWLPLAIAYVASGAGASTDDVDFWDVRPLVKDNISGMARRQYGYSPDHEMQQLYGDIVTGGGGETRISGHFLGQVKGKLAGGVISRGSPGADQTYIDAQDSEWQESGFTVAASELVYFWLMFPYDLPRWVRYNRTPSGGLRYPSGMRGIPLISHKAPNSQGHETPSTSLEVPDYLDGGTGETTDDAVCVVAFTASGANTPTAFVAGGEWVEFLESVAPPANSPPDNGTGNAFDNYTLVAGTDFPIDARKVRVRFTSTFSGVNGNNMTWRIQVGADHLGTGRVVDAWIEEGSAQFDAGASITLSFTFELERIPVRSGLGENLHVQIDWNAGGTSGKSAESCRVVAWKQT